MSETDERTVWQQCALGRDENPNSVCHMPHKHFTRHGHEVACKGWYPLVNGIRTPPTSARGG